MEREVVQIGPCTLYRGDCLDILPTLEPGIVDAVVTDPPYSSGGAFRGDRTQRTITKYVQTGVQCERQEFSGDSRDQRSFLAWCSLWLCAARHAASPGAVLCSFIDWRQLPVMTDAIQSGGWVWRNVGTWWKPGCRMQRGRFSGSAEYLVYATNGPHDASEGECSPQNVISCAPVSGDDKDHIAEKPLDVVRWAVSVSKSDAVVLDPFMGSGTTAEAIIGTDRRFIGFEIDGLSFEIACKRVDRALREKRSELPFEKPEPTQQQELFA